MISAISTALGGMMSASRQAENSAARIAGAASPESETTLIEDMVDLKTAEISYKANAASLRAADDMLKETTRLFDERI